MSDRNRVDDWQVYDEDNDNVRAFDNRGDADDAADMMREEFDNRGDADDAADMMREEFDVATQMYPPGKSPVDDTEADGGFTPGDDGTPAAAAADPVVDESDDETIVDADTDELPERNVGDDPLTWMPSHFMDRIDGTPAINRKGFEVLAHHYDISTTSELEVPPEKTDHTYVRVKATATTPEGRTCDAYGSAHVDRGDDAELLLEMADTRARKRALSVATGVGVVAVEELRNEVDA